MRHLPTNDSAPRSSIRITGHLSWDTRILESRDRKAILAASDDTLATFAGRLTDVGSLRQSMPLVDEPGKGAALTQLPPSDANGQRHGHLGSFFRRKAVAAVL